MAATFHVEVVTPEAQVVSSEAHEVVFPMHDGLVGILPNHAPLLCKLGQGPLTVKGQATAVYYVQGGFGQMVDNRLSLLTEAAIPKEQLSAEAIRKQLEAAEALPHQTPEQQRQRDTQIAQARAKLAMIE